MKNHTMSAQIFKKANNQFQMWLFKKLFSRDTEI